MSETIVTPNLEQEKLFDPNTCPLWQLVGGENAIIYYNHPRRVLQISDKETALRSYEFRKPTFMSVEELWEKLEAKTPFKKADWTYLSSYFGTDSMYKNVNHKLSIHGDGHQDRLVEIGYILGQYKQLTPSEMKVLLVALATHDRSRTDDRLAPDHGLDEARVVNKHLNVFRKRGMKFTEKEVLQVELLDYYHELPFDQVPQFQDDRMNLLIQIMQAADGADRFRSPNPDPQVGWWPKEEYFMRFFDGDAKKVKAFLDFVAYFTLSSEKERFEQTHTHPQFFIEGAIKAKSQEVGIVKGQRSIGNTIIQSLNNFSTRRLVPYGTSY